MGVWQRYTVENGDTLWTISKKVNVPMEELMKVNPQITDGNKLQPGDPVFIPPAGPDLPVCVLLQPTAGLNMEDALGMAMLRTLRELRPGRTAISVLAHGLPEPQRLGDFNAYQALAFIPDLITWQWMLEPTSETFPTWSGTFTEITAKITRNTAIQVRPINTTSGTRGTAILSATLENL